jgi:hypothetical protein
MTREVKVITENETVRQACKLMYQHNIGSIIIIKNNDGKSSDTTKKEIPVGILTETYCHSQYCRITLKYSILCSWAQFQEMKKNLDSLNILLIQYH